MKRIVLSIAACLATLLCLSPAASADARLEQLLRGLDEQPIPAWVKPGARITYWLQATSIQPQQDESGEVKPVATPDMGYRQLTILGVEKDRVLTVTRGYTAMGGSEFEPPILASLPRSVGAFPTRGGEFWIHPQTLKDLMKAKQNPLAQVERIKRKFAGTAMTVIAITFVGLELQFDEASGALVFRRQYSQQAPTNPRDKAGTAEASTLEFRAFEQLNFPWINAKLPAWTQKVKHYNYDGTHTTETPAGMDSIVRPMEIRQTRVAGGTSWFMTNLQVLSSGTQGPKAKPVPMMSGTAIFGLCLPPRELAGLKEGQVLFKNRYTHATIHVVGVRMHQGKRVVVVREDAPRFANEFHYDLTSGVLLRSRLNDKALKQEYAFILKGTK